jgi:hypothetical protein
MGRFDPSKSILAGMDTTLLQARLTAMQQLYLDVSAGGKIESGTYTQGDGSKSVSYSKANLSELGMAIRLLQAQLGIIRTPRRAISFRF